MINLSKFTSKKKVIEWYLSHWLQTCLEQNCVLNLRPLKVDKREPKIMQPNENN